MRGKGILGLSISIETSEEVEMGIISFEGSLFLFLLLPEALTVLPVRNRKNLQSPHNNTTTTTTMLPPYLLPPRPAYD